jgi:periplasmic protein TonB
MFTGLDAVTVIPRRRWTAVASFSAQAAVVAAALVLPFLHPTDLPEAFKQRRIFVPYSRAESPTPPTDQHPSGNGGLSLSVRPIMVNRDNGVHFGRSRPVVGPDDGPPVAPTGPSGPNGPEGPNLGQFPMNPVKPILAKPPVVSVMMQGNLVHRVEPVYPTIAKSTGVQGTVLIKALISSNGRIAQAQVISGSPLLAPAALEAIKQWRYRPYVLNGGTIEVETEITVNFVLSR